MDSNESDAARVDLAAAAEERSRPQGHAPQAAGGAAADTGCPSNTRGHSSLLLMKGYPTYQITGGIDWFEWWSLVHWEFSGRFELAIELFQEAKKSCQYLRTGFQEVHLPGFGPVKVRRVGFNRGGERGQHYDFSLKIPGVSIGLAPRDIDPGIKGRELKKASPNFVAKQTGRDCLLFGAVEGFEMASAFLEALGGRPIFKAISRGDLCLDVVNLNPQDLLALLRAQHFITIARSARPHVNLINQKESGFSAGQHPLYLTVYDKVLEQLGKTDGLYLQALIDRRWGGDIPKTATRIEFQMARNWFRDHGIDSPEDFLTHRGTLSEKLTHDWFRLTDIPVDRKGKHQSRAAVHPLWAGIQAGFSEIFGPSQGELTPLAREKVQPIALAQQGRGCLAACLLQMGVEFRTYGEFVRGCSEVLLGFFPRAEDRASFLKQLEKRRMEYEVS